jgi:hypothetical protein
MRINEAVNAPPGLAGLFVDLFLAANKLVPLLDVTCARM